MNIIRGSIEKIDEFGDEVDGQNHNEYDAEENGEEDRGDKKEEEQMVGDGEAE